VSEEIWRGIVNSLLLVGTGAANLENYLQHCCRTLTATSSRPRLTEAEFIAGRFTLARTRQYFPNADGDDRWQLTPAFGVTISIQCKQEMNHAAKSKRNQSSDLGD
jgi:hypothetical protein